MTQATQHRPLDLPGRASSHRAIYTLTWEFRHPISATGISTLRIQEPANTYPMLDLIASVCRDGPQATDYQGAALQRFQVCQSQWGIAFLWLLQQQLDFWNRQQWPFTLGEVRAWEMFAKVDFLHFSMCKWIADYLPPMTSGYPDHWQHFRALLLEGYRYSITRPLLSKREHRRQVGMAVKEIKELRHVPDPDQPILSELQALIFKAQKHPVPRNTPGRVELQALIQQYKDANRRVRALVHGECPEFSFKVFREKDGELHLKHERWASEPLKKSCAEIRQSDF